MTTGTNPAFPPTRQDPRQVVNTLKRTLNYNDSDVAQAAFFSSLPSGAFVLDVVVEVVTAFNAGTTNTLKLGTNTGSWNNFIAVADVAINSTGVTKISRGWGRLLTSGGDTALFAVYTQSGGAATTGSAIIAVTFEGGFSS